MLDYQFVIEFNKKKSFFLELIVVNLKIAPIFAPALQR